jgi:hypothetical protein
MITTKHKFSPSINIQRDSHFDFNYVATQNSSKVFGQILNDSRIGIKSHVIIGAYGTGKSSLLLATQQTLLGVKKHFHGLDREIKGFPKFEFISFVGRFSSFIGDVAKTIGIKSRDFASIDVVKELDKYYKQAQKRGNGVAILIDEFGKYLEYAAKHNPELELYFIQQLCEWVNNSKSETLLISTLHQDFNAYALSLTKSQQQEWQKVKGRLKEVVFNEPVEQLLFLASERIQERFTDRHPDKNFSQLFESIAEAKVFPLRDYFEKDFARKLLPFDILASAILTLSLQRYGQNERSLFSFIESQDIYGISDFKNGYYNISNVYDYLINNYYPLLVSKYNPHYAQWAIIRNSLERMEGVFPFEIHKHASALIKTIGLLNIFAAASARLEPQFYTTYSKVALEIPNPGEVIALLEKHKIIRYVRHSLKYVLFEGTDLDIELAIDEAGRIVEKVTSVVDHLNHYFEFPFIPAKNAFYNGGTPRFFQFKLTEDPINLIPEGEIDGFINLIFNDDPKAAKLVEEHSRESNEAIVFGYYQNTATVQNTLFEIQKVKKVLFAHSNDKAASKALKEIESYYIKLLNHYVLDCLYSGSEDIVWFFRGKRQKIKDRQSFNKLLSKICDDVYQSTPILKNELLNKTKVSGQIALARRNLLSRLLNQIDQENIGFDNEKFPPEKSIYLSLVKEIGLHQYKEGVWTWSKPTDRSFMALWEAGETFLSSTKKKERNLQEFIDILSSRPFKIKQGLIDYWMPIFLLAKNDEFALYEGETYLPQITADILELINKKPGIFKLKAFDVSGIKLELFNRYRVFLNQAENHHPTNRIFIQTIRPFLAFYRELPDYSKKTNRLSKRTLKLRDVIANAKDPEKAFFEDFPAALGFTIVELQKDKRQSEEFIKKLQESIRELRSSYDRFLDRFESHLIHNILGFENGFPGYKLSIENRFKPIKAHLLLNHQRSLYGRLILPLDDRKAWLSSVMQACLSKPAIVMDDQDEIVLHEKIKEVINELDNLCEISLTDVDEQKEEVLKVEITSFARGKNKKLVRISKSKVKEIDTRIAEVRKSLGADKTINITILTKLLQEELI